MDINEYVDPENEQTFRTVKRLLEKPRAFSKRLLRKLLRREDIFPSELENIVKRDCILSNDFLLECLSWVTRYSFLLRSSADIRDTRIYFCNLNPVDYAIVSGDVKFLTLLIRHGYEHEISASQYRRGLGKSLLTENIFYNHSTGLERTDEFIRAKLEIFSFA